MPSRLFGRKVSVQVDTLLVEDLRIAFKIEKSLSTDPNKVEVSIYNLSEESRKKTQKKDAALIVQAGYEDNIAQIFSGTVRVVSHVLNGGDRITKLLAGDGEKEFRTARINESFAPGATFSQVAKKLLDQLGLKDGNLLSELGKGNFRQGLTDFANGKVAHGLASAELQTLLKSAGLSYSIQDGAIQVLRPGSALELDPVLLDGSAGLVGSPEYGETGKDKHLVLKAKSLLQPGLVPGRRVKIESETTSGLFRVDKVTHNGDTHAQQWYSEIEATALS